MSGALHRESQEERTDKHRESQRAEVNKTLRMRHALRCAFVVGGGTREDAAMVLSWLLEFCGYRKSTFCDDDPNGRQQARLEGRREVGIDVMRALEMAEQDLMRVADEGAQQLSNTRETEGGERDDG